ncbi:GntR family transcriptional regulator [Dactylosporangium sp. CA-092794]|uniref:GntR family transcriptional regulator n=1 Tax=Dactylosporangium sp. CA-092794 TaxID=3239929 RepID=UPI003D8E4B82
MSPSGAPVRSTARGASKWTAAPDPARLTPYEALKKAILSGEFKPGQPLVENALAEWCQTSRTPVREALRRLEQDGLVDSSDRGLVVRKLTPEEILDVYDVRIVLEGTAARVAAERRTDHDLRLLRLLLQKLNDVSESDRDSMVEVNEQFHRAIWKASHNAALLDLLERLHLHLARYPGATLSLGAPGRWAATHREHKRLVDAIDKRDGDTAHRVALAHFSNARDIRLELFADGLPEG